MQRPRTRTTLSCARGRHGLLVHASSRTRDQRRPHRVEHVRRLASTPPPATIRGARRSASAARRCPGSRQNRPIEAGRRGVARARQAARSVHECGVEAPDRRGRTGRLRRPSCRARGGGKKGDIKFRAVAVHTLVIASGGRLVAVMAQSSPRLGRRRGAGSRRRDEDTNFQGGCGARGGRRWRRRPAARHRLDDAGGYGVFAHNTARAPTHRARRGRAHWRPPPPGGGHRVRRRLAFGMLRAPACGCRRRSSRRVRRPRR